MRVRVAVTVTVIVRVGVVSSAKVVIYNLFNQEEAYDSRNDNSVNSHLSWIVRMTALCTTVIMSMTVVVMRMVTAALRLPEMRESVEEDISQETAHGKRYQIIDECVAK